MEIFLVGNGNISLIESARDLQISAGNLVDLEMWALLRGRPDNLHCCFTPHVTINIAITIVIIIVISSIAIVLQWRVCLSRKLYEP